jgi:hypothetical protein
MIVRQTANHNPIFEVKDNDFYDEIVRLTIINCLLCFKPKVVETAIHGICDEKVKEHREDIYRLRC